MMHHGEMFLVAILLVMVFFAWPRSRPAQRKIEPQRKQRPPGDRKD
jgi:hypothetical protein